MKYDGNATALRQLYMHAFMRWKTKAHPEGVEGKGGRVSLSRGDHLRSLRADLYYNTAAARPLRCSGFWPGFRGVRGGSAREGMWLVLSWVGVRATVDLQSSLCFLAYLNWIGLICLMYFGDCMANESLHVVQVVNTAWFSVTNFLASAGFSLCIVC